MRKNFAPSSSERGGIGDAERQRMRMGETAHARRVCACACRVTADALASASLNVHICAAICASTTILDLAGVNCFSGV